MKTLIDLRHNKSEGIIKAIKDFYDEPLKIVELGERSINECIGCWSCWVKTPGRCFMKDEMAKYYANYINSDTVIMLMDTKQGFINHLSKAFIDRTIPHYLPYIEIINDECHHLARYDSYPELVFYYEDEFLTDQEEQVIEDYLYRTAYHFKSKAYRIINKEIIELYPLKSMEPKNKTIESLIVEPMERLIIYNGSPRRGNSNSAIILEKVIKLLGEKVEVRDLKQKDKWDDWIKAFKDDKNTMFFMPLYVHAMPSHVMAFIEKLQVSKGSISFFIQSGFPESSQSYYLEAYFEQLAIRLKRVYLGTAIKGGVESLRMSSANTQDKMIGPIVKAIEHLVYEGSFNQKDIQQLGLPIRFSKGLAIIIKFIFKAGLMNSYWDKQLKKNGAYDKRFDKINL